MKSIVITNLPKIFSEKDLFLYLWNLNRGLKHIVIADDPEHSQYTLNTVVAIYANNETAITAL